MVKYGKNNPSWKGDNAGYKAIHEWLRKNFGSANRCENKNCDKTSKNFHWAKKKRKKYTHDRNAFIQLCVKCHKKYDYKKDTSKKISDSKKGIKVFWKNPDEVKKKLSEKASLRRRNKLGMFIK